MNIKRTAGEWKYKKLGTSFIIYTEKINGDGKTERIHIANLWKIGASDDEIEANAIAICEGVNAEAAQKK